MDFALFTRLAAILFTPSDFLPLLLVLGVVLQWTRYRRWGNRLVIGAAVCLLLIFLLPIDDWLAAPLENRFPRPAWPAHVDGVVVLGGGEDGVIFAARGVPAPDLAEGRLVAAAELSRRYPDAKLIFSGGVAPLSPKALSEAFVARNILRQMGVPPSRVILENRARNTWENFVYSKDLAKPKPGETWLVVTSAIHMPRAMGIAARLHWHVLPWPADYFTTGKKDTKDWNASLASHLLELDGVMHEWAGLAAYWLMGRIGDEENGVTRQGTVDAVARPVRAA